MRPKELERGVAEHFRKNPREFLSIRKELDEYLVSVKFAPAAKPSDPFPISLEPLFLSSQEVASIFNKLKVVLAALVKARAEYLKNSELRSYVGLPPVETEIILNDIQNDIVGNVRADVFLQPDGGIKIVEYNSDYPDALFIDSMVTEYCINLPYVRGIKDIHIMEDCSQLLMRAMSYSFEQNGMSGAPVVGQFAPMDRSWLGEFYAFHDGMKAAGFETYMLDPRKLEFTDGKLSCNGRKINLVRKATEMFYFRENREQLEPFFRSLRNGDFVMYNSFKDRLLGYKTFFSVLTDEKWAYLFTDDEKKVINECVPWTRRILPDTSADALKQMRDKLILKPAGDAEGHGVVVGSSVTDREWGLSVDAVMQLINKGQEWIVQEKVQASRRPVLQWDGKGLSEVQVNFDLMCHFFCVGGEIQGGPLCSRSSCSPVVNTAQGGASHAVFVTD